MPLLLLQVSSTSEVAGCKLVLKATVAFVFSIKVKNPLCILFISKNRYSLPFISVSPHPYIQL